MKAILLLLAALPVFAQQSNTNLVILTTVAPTGSCGTSPLIYETFITGVLTNCQNGTWAQIGFPAGTGVGSITYQKGTGLSNPASGKALTYVDSVTNKFTCTLEDGTSCLTPQAPTPGTSATLVGPSVIYECSASCTLTLPVPQAGYQICAYTGVGVTGTITFNAIGSSAQYSKADRSAYGTAGTGTLAASSAAGNLACLWGRDSTHYVVLSSAGTWTAN